MGMKMIKQPKAVLFFLAMSLSLASASVAGPNKARELEEAGFTAFRARNYEKALELYLKAYDVNSSSKSAAMIGTIYLQGGKKLRDTDEGIKWLNIAIDDGAYMHHMTLARLYACTAVDPSYRNGRKAVYHATEFMDAAQKQNANIHANSYDTLACAYARDGQFNKAMDAMEKAIGLMNDSRKKQRYQERLKLFKLGRPWPDD